MRVVRAHEPGLLRDRDAIVAVEDQPQQCRAGAHRADDEDGATPGDGGECRGALARVRCSPSRLRGTLTIRFLIMNAFGVGGTIRTTLTHRRRARPAPRRRGREHLPATHRARAAGPGGRAAGGAQPTCATRRSIATGALRRRLAAKPTRLMSKTDFRHPTFNLLTDANLAALHRLRARRRADRHATVDQPRDRAPGRAVGGPRRAGPHELHDLQRRPASADPRRLPAARPRLDAHRGRRRRLPQGAARAHARGVHAQRRAGRRRPARARSTTRSSSRPAASRARRASTACCRHGPQIARCSTRTGSCGSSATAATMKRPAPPDRAPRDRRQRPAHGLHTAACTRSSRAPRCT